MERFTVRFGGTVVLDGETFTLDGMWPTGRPDGATASLSPENSGSEIDMTQGGCTRVDGWVYALEKLRAGHNAWARFRRFRPADRRRAIAFGQSVEIGFVERLRTEDGWELSLAKIGIFADRTWSVNIDAQQGTTRDKLECDEVGGTRIAPDDRPLGKEELVTVQRTRGADPLGCPVVRLTIEREPSTQTIVVHAGQVIRIRREARAQLDDLTVTYRGWSEAISEDGNTQMFLELEAQRGELSEQHHYSMGHPWRWGGYVVEVLGADQTHARLRLRRAARFPNPKSQ